MEQHSCQTRRMHGHDYAVPGTYEVTMVVAGRQPVFGEIVGTTKAGGEEPHLQPSPLGQAVLATELPKIHHYYPMVDIWQVCLMPDHIHMIVRINSPLPPGKHLGIVIGAFKGGVSRAWWRMQAPAASSSPRLVGSQATVSASSSPRLVRSQATVSAASSPRLVRSQATVSAASSPRLVGSQATVSASSSPRLVGSQATVSAASAAESRAPLFEPGYNDHILMRDGQLDNWKHYLRDNPRRFVMRREYPDLFRRALCIKIEGVRYSAFGNMLLLRQPEKHQVFFHRYTDGVRTENTSYWQTERERLTAAAMSGDVLVTPGISECEKRIKQMALDQGLRLIHVQSDPIGQYWKPERSRFEACAYGTLLILAPWPEDMPTFHSDYERLHYLNHLAATICAIGHGTSVAVQGLRPAHGGA